MWFIWLVLISRLNAWYWYCFYIKAGSFYRRYCLREQNYQFLKLIKLMHIICILDPGSRGSNGKNLQFISGRYSSLRFAQPLFLQFSRTAQCGISANLHLLYVPNVRCAGRVSCGPHLWDRPSQ